MSKKSTDTVMSSIIKKPTTTTMGNGGKVTNVMVHVWHEGDATWTVLTGYPGGFPISSVDQAIKALEKLREPRISRWKRYLKEWLHRS